MAQQTPTTIQPPATAISQQTQAPTANQPPAPQAAPTTPISRSQKALSKLPAHIHPILISLTQAYPYPQFPESNCVTHFASAYRVDRAKVMEFFMARKSESPHKTKRKLYYIIPNSYLLQAATTQTQQQATGLGAHTGQQQALGTHTHQATHGVQSQATFGALSQAATTQTQQQGLPYLPFALTTQPQHPHVPPPAAVATQLQTLQATHGVQSQATFGALSQAATTHWKHQQGIPYLPFALTTQPQHPHLPPPAAVATQLQTAQIAGAQPFVPPTTALSQQQPTAGFQAQHSATPHAQQQLPTQPYSAPTAAIAVQPQLATIGAQSHAPPTIALSQQQPTAGFQAQLSATAHAQPHASSSGNQSQALSAVISQHQAASSTDQQPMTEGEGDDEGDGDGDGGDEGDGEGLGEYNDEDGDEDEDGDGDGGEDGDEDGDDDIVMFAQGELNAVAAQLRAQLEQQGTPSQSSTTQHQPDTYDQNPTQQ